jgi:hypothetical protein
MFKSNRKAVRIGALGKKMLLLTCAATAVGVAAPQLASAAEPVPGAPAHPSLGGLCNATSITGQTHNETGGTITLTSTSKGITNAWCAYPDGQVSNNSYSNQWQAGDNFFDTTITLSYNISDAWAVSFTATTGDSFHNPSASCGFDGLGTPPYQCSADLDVTNPTLHLTASFHVWKKSTLTHHPRPRTSHPHKGHRHIPPGRHNQHQPSHRTED